ncbi:MAG TPA: glycosyltransferase family 4 protein [Methylocella sp.]|nr:glycosyltransferase family 4 protein [Methylocella sp.]
MGWFAAALVDGLAASGVSVVYVAPPMSPAYREPTNPNIIRIAVPPEWHGSPSRIHFTLSKLKRMAWTLIAIARQIPNSEKFLFTIPEIEIITVPTFLLLRLWGKKVILIVHDPLPHDFALLKRKQLARFLSRLQYHAASVLVTLSEAGRQKLMSEFQISASKIHVIPHGAFGFAHQSRIPGEHVLLAFGSIRQNKNMLEVLEAVKLARASGLDVKLLVAGAYDPSPYCSACEAVITGDPSAFINKTGSVLDEEIPHLIERTDAFILAYSEFDSQSGVAVMAGVNGRPVISSFMGGIAELKPFGLTGVEIEQPITPFTIASAIQEFYKTPLDQWRVAAETGRSKLSYYLDWARLARFYLDL